ncbi:hypothetical protein M0802_010978 [Mischocyttarus mexicanus]|nr:hypothetical protein M0802_010978 [Mischocyttarus mexicanus]
MKDDVNEDEAGTSSASETVQENTTNYSFLKICGDVRLSSTEPSTEPNITEPNVAVTATVGGGGDSSGGGGEKVPSRRVSCLKVGVVCVAAVSLELQRSVAAAAAAAAATAIATALFSGHNAIDDTTCDS